MSQRGESENKQGDSHGMFTKLLVSILHCVIIESIYSKPVEAELPPSIPLIAPCDHIRPAMACRAVP